jgi:hypothetical protein
VYARLADIQIASLADAARNLMYTGIHKQKLLDNR